MTAIDKQRVLGVIILALALLIIVTVAALEAWTEHRTRRRARCSDPDCPCKTGRPTVKALIERASERSS